MAFKMKGSPHKLGTVQGTESALKLGGLVKLVKLVKKVIKGPKRSTKHINSSKRGQRRPDGTRY
jgi:hypothetical protein|tara:strand:- start:49 stop:240 length:192 start_codon:yes stop_codon:yes gene_type:complete